MPIMDIASTMCVICQAEFEGDEPEHDVMRLPCTHKFHTECLLAMSETHNTDIENIRCPSCNKTPAQTNAAANALIGPAAGASFPETLMVGDSQDGDSRGEQSPVGVVDAAEINTGAVPGGATQQESHDVIDGSGHGGAGADDEHGAGSAPRVEVPATPIDTQFQPFEDLDDQTHHAEPPVQDGQTPLASAHDPESDDNLTCVEYTARKRVANNEPSSLLGMMRSRSQSHGDSQHKQPSCAQRRAARAKPAEATVAGPPAKATRAKRAAADADGEPPAKKACPPAKAANMGKAGGPPSKADVGCPPAKRKRASVDQLEPAAKKASVAKSATAKQANAAKTTAPAKTASPAKDDDEVEIIENKPDHRVEFASSSGDEPAYKAAAAAAADDTPSDVHNSGDAVGAETATAKRAATEPAAGAPPAKKANVECPPSGVLSIREVKPTAQCETCGSIVELAKLRILSKKKGTYKCGKCCATVTKLYRSQGGMPNLDGLHESQVHEFYNRAKECFSAVDLNNLVKEFKATKESQQAVYYDNQGKFLPLSVWKTMGYDDVAIRDKSTAWDVRDDPVLGKVYRVVTMITGDRGHEGTRVSETLAVKGAGKGNQDAPQQVAALTMELNKVKKQQKDAEQQEQKKVKAIASCNKLHLKIKNILAMRPGAFGETIVASANNLLASVESLHGSAPKDAVNNVLMDALSAWRLHMCRPSCAR